MGLGTDFGVTGSGYYVSRYTDAPNGTRYIVLNRASAQVEIQSATAHAALELACALAAAAGGAVVEVGQGTFALNTQTVPATVALRMSGGLLSVNSGQTLTIAGPFDAPLVQAFAGSGTVVLAGAVDLVYPQWWGATGDEVTNDTAAFSAAITAAAALNGTLAFVPGTYVVGALTIPSNVSVLPLGGVLSVLNGHTVTIEGTLLGQVSGASIFTGAGTGTVPSSHADATTDVHGIADTAVLATATTLATAVSNHANLADPHTGYQTESGLAATVKAYRLDEFAAPNASVGLGSQKITGLADPVAATDGVNLRTAESLGSNTTWKSAVRVATTADGTLSTAFDNGSTIDGIVLATGDRILIKNQAAAAVNGVYSVAASGAPTRVTDMDTGAELVAGTSVLVNEGTANAGSGWRQATTGVITVDATELLWVQSNQQTAYTATAPITLTGSAFGITSPLPVASGGTNATSASAALTSLGAVPAALVDAKGDLFTASAADTPARLAVGANDTILMADSGETTGLKWVAAATTPSTQAFADAAAAGTADTFTRGDHKHAMPANPITAHEAAVDPHTGYLLETLADAKGDLFVGSAADTIIRKAVGTDGQFLTASAADSGGVAWTTVAPGSGANISGTPAASDLPRWVSASSIGSASFASPSKGAVADMGGAVFNVLAYGATPVAMGSAPTDNITAFEACRDAIVASGRPGVFYMPPGKYGLSRTYGTSTLTTAQASLISYLGGGISERGRSGDSTGARLGGTVITPLTSSFTGTVIFNIVSSSTTEPINSPKLSHFSVDGRKDLYASLVGILVCGFRMRISDLMPMYCGSDGLALKGLADGGGAKVWAAYDSFVTRVQSWGNDGSGIRSYDYAEDMMFVQNVCNYNAVHGINAGGSSNMFLNTHCYYNEGAGLRVRAAAARVFITQCKFEHNRLGGVLAAASASSGIDQLRVTDSEFCNNNRDFAGTGGDLQLGGTLDSGSTAQAITATVVTGNTFRWSSVEDPSGLAKCLGGIVLASNASQSIIGINRIAKGPDDQIPGTSYTDRSISGEGSSTYGFANRVIGCPGFNPRGNWGFSWPGYNTARRNVYLVDSTVMATSANITSVELSFNDGSTWTTVLGAGGGTFPWPVDCSFRVNGSSTAPTFCVWGS